MPTYQYECGFCNHSFEFLQSMLDKKLKKCPECGKDTLHRLIGSGSGIIFKGSGFYETDYKKKDFPKKVTADNGSQLKTKPEESKQGGEAPLKKVPDKGNSDEPI